MIKARMETGAMAPVLGELSYVAEDYAFDYAVNGELEVGTLLFGAVQVVTDGEGRCRYAWGYSPHQGWKPGAVDLPVHVLDGVLFVDPAPLPGDVLVVTAPAETVTTWDQSSGIVSLRSESESGRPFVWACRVAPGITIAGWEDGGVGGVFLEAQLADGPATR